MISILFSLQFANGKDRFERLGHSDHTHGLDERLSQSSDESLALLGRAVFGLGNEVLVEITCESRMTACCDGSDLLEDQSTRKCKGFRHRRTVRMYHFSLPSDLDGNSSSIPRNRTMASSCVGLVKAMVVTDVVFEW